MKTKTYIEKVSIPECTAVHHVWSFDGESPEIGSLCECGQSRWDESLLTKRAADGAECVCENHTDNDGWRCNVCGLLSPHRR